MILLTMRVFSISNNARDKGKIHPPPIIQMELSSLVKLVSFTNLKIEPYNFQNMREI